MTEFSFLSELLVLDLLWNNFPSEVAKDFHQ